MHGSRSLGSIPCPGRLLGNNKLTLFQCLTEMIAPVILAEMVPPVLTANLTSRVSVLLDDKVTHASVS